MATTTIPKESHQLTFESSWNQPSKEENTPKLVLPKKQPQAQERVQDAGLKIGGARKDREYTPFKKSSNRPRKKSNQPLWKTRFQTKKEPDGNWILVDTKTNRKFSYHKYPTKEEAEANLPYQAAKQKHFVGTDRKTHGKFAIYRKITEKKRAPIMGEFNSPEEARQYLKTHAEEILNWKPQKVERPWLTHIQRTGPNNFQIKENVGPNLFLTTFRLRGVEFGNWNTGQDGQAALNHAMDGLLDLARILKVPPQALGFKGDLALAFGSRGHGLSGARAHYEPEYIVINLTKIRGAGNLAHEWFHGLDHFLARLDGKAISKKLGEGETLPKQTDKYRFQSLGHSLKSRLPEKPREAFQKMLASIHKLPKETEITPEQEEIPKQRLFSQIQHIENLILTGKKPLNSDEKSQLENAVKHLKEAQGGEFVELPSKIKRKTFTPHIPKHIATLHHLAKKATGRGIYQTQYPYGPANDLQTTLNNYNRALHRLKQSQNGVKLTVNKTTEFYKNAYELDQVRTSDYHTQPYELMARTFEAWAVDTLTQNNQRSDYLIFGAENIYYPPEIKPYPEGEERKTFHDITSEMLREICPLLH